MTSSPPVQADFPAPSDQQSRKTVKQEQNTEDGGIDIVERVKNGKHAGLATPAVRALLRELRVDIADIIGTGKEGRVMKEDVQKFAAAAAARENIGQLSTSPLPADKPQVEKPAPLTPIQSQMFKTMTRSLTIPHFLYADEINLNPLTNLRKRLNTHPTQNAQSRLSFLPFIIKAVSCALVDFPLLNARVEETNTTSRTTDSNNNNGTTTTPSPQLIMRQNHNIGVAMDTPQGLLVPNIKNVAERSILDIAAELSRLQSLAHSGKLTITDLSGGTITVSNIGSIGGGTYVAPVIVPTEVAILGIGRAKVVPAFDDEGQLVKKDQVQFSWSADHRVVDGATMARMAERVKGLIEEPGLMVVGMK